jgi:tetratricopeptide (TPR) repeat protein
LAKQRELTNFAAGVLTTEAVAAAFLGNCASARSLAREAIALDRDTQTLAPAATALGLCGDAAGAMKLADETRKEFPDDTLNNQMLVPVIQAAIEIQRGAWQAAIDALQPARRYERVNASCIYLRAVALLKLAKYGEAAVEFERISLHPEIFWQESILIPLSRLGLARSAALAGDKPKAKKAYEALLAEWKDADRDLPAMAEAQKELAALP